MKKITKTLALLAFLFSGVASALHAQSAFYWSDGRRLDLYEDRTSAIIHFDGPVVEHVLTGMLKENPEVHSVAYFAHRKRAVLHFYLAQDGSAADLVDRLGLQEFTVRSAHFGFTLDDGFQTWLTHHLVLRMKPGLDRFLLTPFLGDQARFFDEAYGNIRFELDDIHQVLPVANLIRESGLVEYCHPDFYAPVSRFQDPLFPVQFQMHNTGQKIDGHTGVEDIDIDGPEAWAITTGSSSVIIAMVDDGVENHEDMNDGDGNSRIIGGFTPKTGGNGAPTSSGAHGQACAGIAGASHNSVGVRGVSPLSRFLTVNIFAGGESAAEIANGINWAVNNGAWILSNSWGYSSCTISYQVLTDAIHNAATNGRGGKGCVVVFASGNGTKGCVDYPGNLPDVLAVGAVTNQGVRSSYSNYGPELDVVAPSNGAAGVRTADRMGTPGYNVEGNYYNYFGGTSAACPAAAGIAALVLAVNPDLTGDQVRSILQNTADDMGPAGFDMEYGYGRVNAHQAILCAQNGGDCTLPPPPPPPSYCPSKGIYASEEWISKVAFGSFSHNSGSAGYSDFTNLVINAAPGNAYDVSITPAFSGQLWEEYFRVWIDFNQDLDFDDPGENVFSAGPSSETVNGVVTIPLGAIPGETRMRVSMKWGSFPNSCESFSFGEVEDYTLKIEGGGDPSCDVPGGLAVADITPSSANLSWNTVGTASSYDLRFRPAGGVYTQVDNIAGTSYPLTGLTAATTYEWSVRANCSGDLSSEWSSNASFTTTDDPVVGGSYCEAGGQSADLEWIDLVQIGAINNVSGKDGGYADYTNLVATVSPGLKYPIFFSKGSDLGEYGYWRIYVDWNQDGDFADPGERETSGRSKSNGTLSVSISVPPNALLGTTRMRVMMKYGGYPSYCEVYERGETEDYTLEVVQGFTQEDQAALLGNMTVAERIEVSPNPCTDMAWVQIYTQGAVQQAFISDLNGRVVMEISPKQERQDIPVANLPEGMYLVVVKTDTGVFSSRLVKIN